MNEHVNFVVLNVSIECQNIYGAYIFVLWVKNTCHHACGGVDMILFNVLRPPFCTLTLG